MSQKQDIAQLAQKASAGDPDAMNALISIHYQKFYNLAYQTVKDPDVAADVTQDSCMEILATISNLQNPNAFATWSQRIVYHQCMRHFRNNREVQFEENEDGETILDTLPDEREGVLPESVTENKEFKQILKNMLDSLPAEQRAAMLLYYYEKLSVKQIADIQGVTEGTVKSRLNYGRRAVKQQVEDYEKKSGIRLHSIAPLPLLLLWMFQTDAAEVAAASTSAAAATTAAAATASTTAAAAGSSALATKIVAGVLAATLVAGGAVVGAKLLQEPPPETTVQTVPAHIHQFDFGYGFDTDSHFLMCVCGEAGPAESHTFDYYECTVCQCGNLDGPFWVTETDGVCYISGSYASPFGCWVIPETENGLPITAIATEAFLYDYRVISVCIPDSITAIGEGAFRECTGLYTIYIPGSIQNLSDSVFRDCTALTNVTLEKGIVSIGADTFRGCTGLTKVALPASISQIGACAFAACTGLETVYLPAGLQSLGTDAFSHCPALKDIYFAGTMEQWHALTGGLTVPDWAAESGAFTVHCVDGELHKKDL